jgi:hypothetical protein
MRTKTARVTHFARCSNYRKLHTSDSQPLCKPVVSLSSWDLTVFREKGFYHSRPCILPRVSERIPLACSKWFIHDSSPPYDLGKGSPRSSELRSDFWRDYEQTLVPLEVTAANTGGRDSSFRRGDAPLSILLSFLGGSHPSVHSLDRRQSIYLAQCSLSSLPESLRADVPTPSIVLDAGKGDVYESSLWMGRPPTYTPLHRDPNPNFLMQLAGRKVVRLFPPDIGAAIFEYVQDQLRSRSVNSGSGSATMRGEEMMAGPEKELLHNAVWCQLEGHKLNAIVKNYGEEAEVGLGEALFIPKGWWHSVKGIGEGVTASVNWWFR